LDNRQIDFFRKIVWLSFGLAVAVVVRHSVNFEVYRLEPGILYCLQKYISVCTDLVVPTFFIISGYLFYRNFDYSCCLRKWATRFSSLVIPYIIWNLAAYFYYVAITSIPFVADSMSKSVEPLGFASIFANALYGEHNVTWFIRYLIVFVYLTPLLYFALKRKMAALCIIVVMLALHGFLNCTYWTYAAVFLVGGVISLFCDDFVTARKATMFWSAISIAYLLFTTILEWSGFIETFIGYVYPTLRVSQAIAIWWAVDLFHPLVDPPWWAKLSFPIYVMHSMILESIEKLILIILGRNSLCSIIDLIFAPIFTLALIMIVSRLMQKHMHSCWLLINGGRAT